MVLRQIEVSNFRCYQHCKINLGKQATIFIGKNGSGKSSVLSALRKGLSFIFSDNKNEVNPLKANNNATVSAIPLWDTRYNELEDGFQWPTSLKYEIEFDGQFIHWEFFKKSHQGNLHPSLYKDAREYILSALNNQTQLWPVYAFFGDSYPHLEVNLGAKASKIIQSDILPRDFAYYGWDMYQNCNVLWQDRFKQTENLLLAHKSQIESRKRSIKDLYTRIEATNNPQELDRLQLELKELQKRLDVFVEANTSRIQLLEKERNYIEARFITFTEALQQEREFINTDLEIISLSVEVV